MYLHLQVCLPQVNLCKLFITCQFCEYVFNFLQELSVYSQTRAHTVFIVFANLDWPWLFATGTTGETHSLVTLVRISNCSNSASTARQNAYSINLASFMGTGLILSFRVSLLLIPFTVSRPLIKISLYFVRRCLGLV